MNTQLKKTLANVSIWGMIVTIGVLIFWFIGFLFSSNFHNAIR